MLFRSCPDGLNPRAAAGFIEFHQTEFVHQIADAQSRQTLFLRFGNQFFNPHHTVGNRKLGMQAQRDVGRLGHGKIGVNNKRRIVAKLEKGRLKRSEAGFQTTSTVGVDGGSIMVSVCLAINENVKRFH